MRPDKELRKNTKLIITIRQILLQAQDYFKVFGELKTVLNLSNMATLRFEKIENTSRLQCI